MLVSCYYSTQPLPLHALIYLNFEWNANYSCHALGNSLLNSLLRNALSSTTPLNTRSIHACTHHQHKASPLRSHMEHPPPLLFQTLFFSPMLTKLFDEMPNRDVVSRNSVLSMRAKAGRINSSQELFDKIPQRNSVSWTSMLVGFIRLGRFREAVATFLEMVWARIVPTQFTFTNVLSSCASLETACIGQKVHSFAVETGTQ
jgi:pentatricopeptide repeat protein